MRSATDTATAGCDRGVPRPPHPARRAARLLVGLAIVLSALPAWAEWTVSKDPMGPGYLVQSTEKGVAGFKAPTKASADAQAAVLNKFEKQRDRKENRK